jgi:hypothetical protein
MTIVTTTSTKVDVEETGGAAAVEKAGERVVRDEGVIRGTHATTDISGTTTMATMTAAAVGIRRTGCGQPEMLTRGDRRGRCRAMISTTPCRAVSTVVGFVRHDGRHGRAETTRADRACQWLRHRR